MDQTTGRDNLLDTTIIGLTDNVVSVTGFYRSQDNHIEVTSNTLKNLQFGCWSRILLFKGDRESFQECFVQNVVDESSIIGTLTLGVGVKYVESFLRLMNLPIFLRKTPLPSRMD